MTNAKKYYAVKRGRKPGIYSTWATAKAQVEGFSGAQYRGFADQAAAHQYLNDAEASHPTTAATTSSTRPTIVVFTDGGSRNHGNVAGGHVQASDPAAWAYLIDYAGRQHADSAGEWGVTNNKMEITALVKALQWLRAHDFQHEQVGVVSDSRYVLNAIQKGWLAGWQRRGWKRAAGELKNKELWQQLAALLTEFTHLQLAWTKGHATNQGNVYVDERLNQTMDQMERERAHDN
ncbi:ribonuclease H family protein [Fructilactobacillus myrtifloralis]|uniref:ribonuclease H n=1 Tax=Fructilactobacillus myrtifloralis TaxID=2940301 RepID=A0ABY5BM86_9LACO|nr:ribonuclease H family protein [Fructilactobacillus myrtifloralis]USS84793.1 ribonuclease H family protein [Fructilactobacillus myrtifloralis]